MEVGISYLGTEEAGRMILKVGSVDITFYQRISKLAEGTCAKQSVARDDFNRETIA